MTLVHSYVHILMKQFCDLNLFRYLSALAQYGRLDRAAFHLGVSRSTINRALSELRDNFGNELFIVDQGQYSATRFTKELLVKAEPAMDDLSALYRSADDYDFTKEQGTLVVYAPNAFSDLITLKFYLAMQERGSQLKFESRSWPAHGIPNFNSEEIAIGLNTYPFDIDKQLVQHYAGDFPLGIFCRKGHELLTQDIVDISTLTSDLKLVRMSPKVAIPKWLREKSAEYIPTVAADLTVSSLSVALACVEQHDFCMFAHHGGYHLNTPNVDWRPIGIDGEIIKLKYGWIHHRTWYQHPIMKVIKDIIHDVNQSFD